MNTRIGMSSCTNHMKGQTIKCTNVYEVQRPVSSVDGDVWIRRNVHQNLGFRPDSEDIQKIG